MQFVESDLDGLDTLAQGLYGLAGDLLGEHIDKLLLALAVHIATIDVGSSLLLGRLALDGKTSLLGSQCGILLGKIGSNRLCGCIQIGLGSRLNLSRSLLHSSYIKHIFGRADRLHGSRIENFISSHHFVVLALDAIHKYIDVQI